MNPETNNIHAAIQISLLRILPTFPEAAQQTSHEWCLTKGAQDGPLRDHRGRRKKIFSGLNPNKAAGHDKLQPQVLKELADVLDPMVTLIYIWKTANVSPIFKKGEKYKESNYYPVSLTCMCPVKMYGMHCDHPGNATSYQDQHPVQPPAWLKIQTLNRNPTDWVHQRHAERNDRWEAEWCGCDGLAKAFDKVSHTRLLHKLHMYGIDPKTWGWSRSFLCGRTQYVVLDREASEVEITSGLPQGLVLGPIIFFLMRRCGRVYQTLFSQLFADDIIIYLTLTVENDCKGPVHWQWCAPVGNFHCFKHL